MADRGAEAVAYSSLIEFEAFRRSIWMGMAWKGLESDFQRAKSVVLNSITDNIVIDNPDDQEALETPPTFTTATMNTQTYSRALVRGTSQYNVLQAMEGPGPARLDMTLVARLAAHMAIGIDSAAFAHLTSATFGAAAGNGFETGAVGTAFTGTNAAGLDRRTGRFKIKGNGGAFGGGNQGNQRAGKQALFESLVESMQDAELLYRVSNVQGGDLIGDGKPTGFAFVAHPILGRALVNWASVAGVLDLEASAARQAAKGSGILSNMAYEGRVANFDVMTTTALGHTNTAATVSGYFVPLGAAMVGGVRPMLWDFARYGRGNTGGAAVARSTVICPYFAGRAHQELLGRVTVNVG